MGRERKDASASGREDGSVTEVHKPQADKFRDMARELECDEDEAAFEDKVRRVATAPKQEVEEK